jgi:phosphatidylinositol 4-kinase
MAIHVRRMLMTPLPAFESDMLSCGFEISPAVWAASRCLAICIEVSQAHVHLLGAEYQVSPDDDLMSSTLYSLLNTLTHGTTLPPGGAVSVRSHSALVRDGDQTTIKSNLSGGKRTEEQRRIMAMTAVEVVSRLALEIGRDDVS